MQLGESGRESVLAPETPPLGTPLSTAWVGQPLVEQDVVGEHESLLIVGPRDQSERIRWGCRSLR
jgi:hypothetical protein